MKKIFKIGTRGSKLAHWQAEHICNLLSKNNSDLSFDIVTLKTTGDERSLSGKNNSDLPNSNKNVFIKEIEYALLNGDIDLAVHSLKDMSSSCTKGLLTTAFIGGASRCDVLVSENISDIKDAPPNSRIGTSSARRACQLKMIRNDLDILPIQGNVDTRIRKMKNGEFDAIILAKAGLERLNLLDDISYCFSYDEIVPAAGQGIMAVQLREDDRNMIDIAKFINDVPSEYAARLEFGFMKDIGADCDVPLGVLADIIEDVAHITVFLSSIDINYSLKLKRKCNIVHIEKTAIDIADEVKDLWKQKTGKDLIFSEK